MVVHGMRPHIPALAADTRIALANGAQVPAGDLRAGDRILTRDAGVQTLRHTIAVTLSRTARHGLVALGEGALCNARAMLASPDLALFFHQRGDPLGLGQADCLIRARHLVDGTSVTEAPQTSAPGICLVLDGHHLIFAEGIAVESFRIDPQTAVLLPAGARANAAGLIARHDATSPTIWEIGPDLVPPGPLRGLVRAALSA